MLEHSYFLQSFCFHKFSYSHQYEWSKKLLDSTLWRSCKPKSSHSRDKNMWNRMCLVKGRSWWLTSTERVPQHQNKVPFRTSETTGHSLRRLEYRSFPHPSHKNLFIFWFPSSFCPADQVLGLYIKYIPDHNKIHMAQFYLFKWLKSRDFHHCGNYVSDFCRQTNIIR